MMDFSKIASTYERESIVQKSAADILSTLLRISSHDDVIDIGCGTGNLTKKIKSLTHGKVVGIDPSPGMIEEAILRLEGQDIIFHIGTAEDLIEDGDFDVVFCNSAFQWLRDPKRAVDNFHKALRKGGRVGIQAPAKRVYCPNFIDAVERVREDSSLQRTFAHFQNPWFFLETSDDYMNLFEESGFTVPFSKIEQVATLHSAEEVFRIFSSGAIAGYLNQDFYNVTLDEGYIEGFKEVIRNEFARQENQDGKVELLFNRIMLIAVKE
ncbi:malonyl-[acyl-carrier protein] O-methyltransferase [Peptococcaceae bacterium CEB3]|nr:malonyl-[acyl-carrier protein] O-methyltransferase [Peptococcaceae bacterium CEB3]